MLYDIVYKQRIFGGVIIKTYINARKELLKIIRDSAYCLQKESYISKKSYKKMKKMFVRKQDVFNALNEFDSKYIFSETSDTKLPYQVYGKSEIGKELIVYTIDNGNYDNTILITSTSHGFEGKKDHDGLVLSNVVTDMAKYYYNNSNILGNTRLVIVPCVNPDGAYDGIADNDFGRLNINGIDINRDFDESKFCAKESIYLKELIDKYKPDYHIDLHGWYNALYGDKEIINAFYNNDLIDRKYVDQYGATKGYIIGYTHNNFNTKSALVEFPDPNLMSTGRLIAALNEVMIGYNSLNSEFQSARDLSKGFSDLRRMDKDFIKKLIRK